MTTYYVRANGEAANKEAATVYDPDDVSKSMSMATMNGETFAAGDYIRLSSLGGDYATALVTPLQTGLGLTFITNVTSELALPTIKPTGAVNSITSSQNVKQWSITNMIVDGSGASAPNHTVYCTRTTQLENLRVYGQGTKVGIWMQGSNADNSVKSCEVSGASNGIQISSTHQTLADIDDCICHDNLEHGMVCPFGTTINNFTSYDNGESGLSCAGVDPVIDVNDSLIYNNGIDGVTISGSAVVTCFNVTSHSHQGTEQSGYGDGFTAHETATLKLHNCIAYGNIKAVTGIQDSEGEIINCVFYNNYDPLQTNLILGQAYGAGIFLNEKTGGHWDVNNNICQNNGLEMAVDYDSGSTATLTSDYNCLYNERGGDYAYYWMDTFYDNLTAYQSNSSQDANSIDDDPLLANPANQNFIISFFSPTIAASIADINFKVASMTTAIKVIMGVSSLALLGDDADKNLLSVDDDATNSFLQYRGHATVATSARLAYSRDGTNATFRVGTWDVGDEVLVVSQVLFDDPDYKIRAGYSFAPYTSIIWDLTPADYDGSYQPNDFLRLAFGNTTPLHIKQIQVWDKVASDNELLLAANSY